MIAPHRLVGSVAKNVTQRTTSSSIIQTRFVQPRRNFSKSSKSNANKNPPEIKFDQQGNSILHQKAAKAAELHAELNTLLETQAQRRADEANRHFGAGFIDFVKASKSEIINIFAAFTCVILAYQISNIRKGARKLIESAEEQNEKIEDSTQILRIISSTEFLKKVSNEYHVELNERGNMNGTNTQNIGTKKILGGWFASNSRNNEEESSTNEETPNDILVGILQRELGKVMGDRALTSAEIEELKLVQLQREMGLVQEARKERTSASDQTDDSLGELGQVLIEVQQDDSGEGRTVVKRSKGFI